MTQPIRVGSELSQPVSAEDDALVEVMARAICRYNWPGGSPQDIDDMNEAWIGEARAALAALREREGR